MDFLYRAQSIAPCNRFFNARAEKNAWCLRTYMKVHLERLITDFPEWLLLYIKKKVRYNYYMAFKRPELHCCQRFPAFRKEPCGINKDITRNTACRWICNFTEAKSTFAQARGATVEIRLRLPRARQANRRDRRTLPRYCLVKQQ